ncbi:hypothetical protein Tco_1315574 [Tanacetum coccineum]
MNTYCDDISNAKAFLMANISNYGSDVISEANKEQNSESVTAELERYKERVKTFEQRLNIDLSSREKMIDSQMDDMIKEKLALKEQVDSLKQNLSKQIKEKECLLQTFTVFKSESKEKEDKYMENEIDLENKIKKLDNIIFKVGYQNPFYLKKAHRIKPTLYDGRVISAKHVAMLVINDEEILILEEESRLKMSEKEKDPEAIKQNISHKPIDYEKLNRLSDDFGKRFTSQQELSAEQAFWLRMSNPTSKPSYASPVKIEAPKELPKVSLVNESLKKLKFHLARFDNVVKIRTTPDARIEDLLNEIMEVQIIFDQMDAAVQQSSVDKQCLEIVKKELLLENDQLLQQIMSQDVLLTVMNYMSLFGESVNMDRKRKESCDKCFNLEAEFLKSQNAFNDILKKFFENNDLKAQLQGKDSTICKLKDIIKSMREKFKEDNVKYNYCEIETKNVELENSVAKLLSENERLSNEINHVKQVFKEQFDSIKKTRVRTKEQIDSLIDKPNLKYAENEDLKAQLQDKVFVITSLKNNLQKVKGKEIMDYVAQIPSTNTIVPGMFKLDLELLAPRLLQNREAHIDYLKYTQEQADILRGIVKQAKAEQPLDKELDFASIMSSALSTITYTSVYTDSEPDRAFWEPMMRRYITESDLEEDLEEYEDDETEDDSVDYPMDGGDDGDDDDGDSSGDDADDEDEEDEEEEEEHLAPADSTIVLPTDEPVSPPEGTDPAIPPPSTDITIGARITIRPQASISLPPEAEVERLLAMTTPSPSQPISLSPPSAGERLARCIALPAHSSPPPALIDAVTAALPSPLLPPPLYIPPPVDHAEERGQGIRDVRYGIRDTWIDPAETVLEVAPMTMGEVNNRVTELAELLDMISRLVCLTIGMLRNTRGLCSREAWASQSIGLSRQPHRTSQTPSWRARRSRPDARIPDHQDALGMLTVTLPSPRADLRPIELANHMMDSEIPVPIEVLYLTCSFSSLIDIAPTPLDNSYDVELADGKIVGIDTIIRVPYRNETLTFHGNESNNGRESRLTVISCSKAQEYMATSVCQVLFGFDICQKEEDKSERTTKLRTYNSSRFSLKYFPRTCQVFPPARPWNSQNRS